MKPATPRRLLVALAPIIGYVTLILAVSSLTHPTDLLPAPLLASDKLLHMVEYGVLGLLVARALRMLLPAARVADLLILTTLLCLSVGALDEFVQWHMPMRSAEWGDVAADTLGGFLGASLHCAVHVLVRRRAAPADGNDCEEGPGA